jgi:predicted cupin superfamily sugar epimerase
MNEFNPSLLVSTLNLAEHPEGGYYRRTYASDFEVQGSRGPRKAGSAIYYLLEAGCRSRLHRIDADEMWHHYLGDQLIVVEIAHDGTVTRTVLGKDIARGEKLQHLVKAGVWFGAYIPEGSRGALMGCTVNPEFMFETFEIAQPDQIKEIVSPSDFEYVQKLI